MNRPSSVLMKGIEQRVTCQCGHSFFVPYGEKQATCPECKQSVTWRLSK